MLKYIWSKYTITTQCQPVTIKKINTEAVNDYPPIRFERKFPIVGLYFLTLHVETLWNYVPRGKAIWNANGGFVSVLLTHLFCFSIYFISTTKFTLYFLPFLTFHCIMSLIQFNAFFSHGWC